MQEDIYHRSGRIGMNSMTDAEIEREDKWQKTVKRVPYYCVLLSVIVYILVYHWESIVRINIL